jgi:hypothetical protein
MAVRNRNRIKSQNPPSPASVSCQRLSISGRHFPASAISLQSNSRQLHAGQDHGAAPYSSIACWVAVFELAGIPEGHARRFRDTFAVGLLQASVPMERVSVLLGHSSIKVTEKYYSPWVRARQEQLEADVRRTWELPERVEINHTGRGRTLPMLGVRQSAAVEFLLLFWGPCPGLDGCFFEEMRPTGVPLLFAKFSVPQIDCDFSVRAALDDLHDVVTLKCHEIVQHDRERRL